MSQIKLSSALPGQLGKKMVTAGNLYLAGRCQLPILNPAHLLLGRDDTERRRFSSANSEWDSPPEFDGDSAYEILGVSETSSFDQVKASFRKLAKETHPDLASSEASNRFVQILAAYEILSDPKKRSLYDQYLMGKRNIEMNSNSIHRQGSSSSYHMYATYVNSAKEMEVVEWLRWYRQAVKDIVSERKVIGGSGYFDVLHRDFYSAIHSAYYGPDVEPIDLLPDRFEAEERSTCNTPEVLHLVSGRDFFGVVRIADKVPELSGVEYRKLAYGESSSFDSFSPSEKEDVEIGSEDVECKISDAYKNLELHVFGRLVATATRVPPESSSSEIQMEDSEDKIYVFTSSCEEPVNEDVSKAMLGTIIGLGNDAEESSCFVYDKVGEKTHMILKHRTLLVKHMHWFQLRDEVSICECRCTRARLPPSKYWLFEPRCSMHDIGGWYVETYGLDKKRRNVPCQRYWNGFEAALHSEKKLHPAVYLLALAYRTLDIEIANKRKQSIKNVIGGNLFRIFCWCKKLV